MIRKLQREGARVCRAEKTHNWSKLYTMEEGGSEHLHTYNYCTRCARMDIARTYVLKMLLPGINKLFGLEYKKHTGTTA